MMAAAKRWAATRIVVVAVSSGSAIGGMSDKPVATMVTTRNRRRARNSRAKRTPSADPTRVHNANAAIGIAVASTSRLTSAARAMAAIAVVQPAATTPASPPRRTRTSVLG